MMYRIGRFERGLVFRDGAFERLLLPGRYSRLMNRVRRETVEIVDTRDGQFQHDRLDEIVAAAQVRAELDVLEVGDNQRALIWRDGRMAAIVGPGRYAFWKAPQAIRIEVFEVGADRFQHDRLDAVMDLPNTNRWFEVMRVPNDSAGVLRYDGRLVEVLGAGRYVYWRRPGSLNLQLVELREQQCDVGGQDIMTGDKVTLRLNLNVTYRVRQALQAVTSVTDYADALYREAQLAIRSAIGARSLDEVLVSKDEIGNEVRETLRKRADTFGIEIVRVGLRDIILPGEMKQILNQVIQAEKQAQANLIRRREETAAARSQANTAKLLAENPTLVRIKEMEALQEILAGTKATFVFGQGDLAEQVRGLIAERANN